MSMETSTFPKKVKETQIRPLLKKTCLPKNELKKYKPVSNLSFISRILEKVVANRRQTRIKIAIYQLILKFTCLISFKR